MRLRARLTGDQLVPELRRPQVLPPKRPYGPSQEPYSWASLNAHLVGLLDALQSRTLSHKQGQAGLDECYAQLVEHFERQVALATDTPFASPSGRGLVPTIVMVPARQKCARHRKSWVSLERPVRWLLCRPQDAHRALCTDPWDLLFAADDLVDAPSECQEPPLLDVHLLQCLLSDLHSDCLNVPIACHMIDGLMTESRELLKREAVQG